MGAEAHSILFHVKVDESAEALSAATAPKGPDIRQAYRRIALMIHPDKNPGNDERCKEALVRVQEARATLEKVLMKEEKKEEKNRKKEEKKRGSKDPSKAEGDRKRKAESHAGHKVPPTYGTDAGPTPAGPRKRTVQFKCDDGKDASFLAGDDVTLKGLSEKDLNGQRAVVMPASGSPQNGRVTVKLRNSGRQVAIKLENLEKASVIEADDSDDSINVEAQGVAAFRLLGENKKIEDYFEFGEPICVDAKGMGTVFNAKRKGARFVDCQECVVKVRPKRGFTKGESAWCTSMTRLLTSDCFPNLLEIEEIFEDKEVYYIVMAKCCGGELFDFPENEVDVPLSECKRIIREILFSLKDLHSLGLIHRDVKPENIMFDEPARLQRRSHERTLKLIDFDSCVPWDPNPRTSKPHFFQGTHGYIAPEVLVGRSSPQSDLFAVGVILFLSMTGEMPWSSAVKTIKDPQVDGPNAKVLYEALRNEQIDWDEPDSIWLDFPWAADLCKQLLAFDPSDRIASATEALNHPWLQTKMS